MKSWLALLGLLLILIGPATSQSLTDLEGKPHTLAELASKPDQDAMVLVVWCSRCGSCRSGERDLAAYTANCGPRVKVYALSCHPTDSPERIKTFLSGQGIKLNVMRDPTQALVVTAMKIDRTTTALVYDKTARLRYIGPFQGDGKGFARDAVADILAGREVGMKSRPLKG